MSKVIVIVGYGPGISTAVAETFGGEGFAVALVARNPANLQAGVAALEAKGIRAIAVPADASHPDQVRAAIEQARGVLGPVTVLHWNAISGTEAGDLLATDPAAAGRVFDVAVVGLLAAVQEALPDLKSTGEGAILVTNGAYGEMTPLMDAFAVTNKAMGVGLANAAKHKLVGMLSQQLKGDGVYVGEVMVAGAVKGTPWAGDDGIEGARIASEFWRLYKDRDGIRARVS